MISDSFSRRTLPIARFDAQAAATIAGLIGGTAYLAAQTFFALLDAEVTAWAPLQRIGAMVLGADAAPPSRLSPVPVIGMALLIHTVLSIIYGHFIGMVVRRFDMLRACLLGAIVGLMLFGLNLFVIAPGAFPWFDGARTLTTAADHMLFGGVTAAGCVLLRRRDHGTITI